MTTYSTEQMLPVNCSMMKPATQTGEEVADQEIHRKSKDDNSRHGRYYKCLKKKTTKHKYRIQNTELWLMCVKKK